MNEQQDDGNPQEGAVPPWASLIQSRLFSGPGEEAPSGASLWAVLIANSIPALAVLFLGWDAFTVVFLYWMENVIIGIITALKILLASGPNIPGSSAAKFFLVPFFCVHYGIFCAVHGVFIFVLLGGGMGNANAFPGGLGAALPAAAWSFGVALIALTIEQCGKFYRDYIRSGKYRETSPVVQMFSPYGRIVVMHLTILFGAFLMVALKLPQPIVILLVILKTGYEVGSGRVKSLVTKHAAQQ